MPTMLSKPGVSGTTAPTLADPTIFDNPYPLDAQMRDIAPVYFDPVLKMFMVTGYAVMKEIMADVERFSSLPESHVMAIYSTHPDVVAMYEKADAYPPINTLVTNDPPLHQRYRALIDKAVGATNSRKLTTYIEQCADALIDDIGDTGRVDFVSAFALKLPLMVISHLLGTGPEFMETARAMSASTTRLADGAMLTHEELLANHQIQIEGQKQFDPYIDRYMDEEADNLVSHFLRVSLDNGEKLSRREIHSAVQVLLVGGNDSTPGALSNSVALLACDADLQNRLRANPELIGAFIEESLRMESPVQGMYRRATVDTEVGGTFIPAGSPIILRFGAANRDPAHFGCPAQIDLNRKGLKNHMAFGHGIHYCVGNILARLELRVALERLLARLDDIRIDPVEQQIDYESKLIVRNPKALWLAYRKR